MNTKAQKPGDYQDQWKKVDQFEKKGLTASARKEAESIFILAGKENNPPQEIKAAIHLMMYRVTLEEDALKGNILFLDSIIKQAKEPARQVLHSLKAKNLEKYLQQNRYRLYDRSKTINEKDSDMDTWSADKLFTETANTYLASIQNKKLLQNTPLLAWEPILIPGENTEGLRPTLYDILAHRALDFFRNDEHTVTKPADRFIINHPSAFAPVQEFVHARFAASDSLSHAWQALRILQEILSFHLADEQPGALLDADLIRLQFVYEKAVISNKDQLYEKGLMDIEKRMSGHPLSAEAMYLRARLYASAGETYHPVTNPKNQFEKKRAAELCRQAIASFPGSDGAKKAQQLLNGILHTSFSIQAELVNIPGLPSLALLGFRNLPRLHLRLIPVTKQELEAMQKMEYPKDWSWLASKKATREWTEELPDPKDHQEHRMEIRINPTEPGTYMLLASKDAGFGTGDNVMHRVLLYSSRISYIVNNDNEVYVLDRETGLPLDNTKIEVWKKEYNYQSRIYEKIRLAEKVTDKKGFADITGIAKNTNYLLHFYRKNDELSTDQSHYSGYYNGYEKNPRKQTFFFTDRSIYRPGQDLMFKAIIVESQPVDRKYRVVTNEQMRVSLLDANGQKVKDLVLNSNDYGSASGRFTLPKTGLTGQFRLFDSANQSTSYFQVEEYKRPAFFVEIPAPAGTYRVNDSISVKGRAGAYAGYPIDQGKVRYRVTRKTILPLWERGFPGMMDRTWFPGGGEEMEISNGETSTDQDGQFHIRFKAIPDESTDKKWQPVFHYEVKADVTDRNGETRSDSRTVAVSYQAFQVSIESPEQLSPDSLGTVKIFTKNNNDLFEKTKLSIEVHALASPGRFIKKRYWTRPDLFHIGREAFMQSFPHDPYDHEDDPSLWPLRKKIMELSDTTRSDGKFSFSPVRLNDGWYKVIATGTDSRGEEVRSEKIIRVRDGMRVLPEDGLSLINPTTSVKPGDRAAYSYVSSFDETWVLHFQERPGIKKEDNSFLLKQDKPQTFGMTISEADRGGIIISSACVKYNRVFSLENDIGVPWSNKKLDIRLETFRDKTLPGATETWTVSIKGESAAAAAAEMLAGMYDASLDQFMPHSWKSLSHLWPMTETSILWNQETFRDTDGQGLDNQSEPEAEIKPRRYPGIRDDYASYGIASEMGFSTKRFALNDAVEKAAMAAPAPQGDASGLAEKKEVNTAVEKVAKKQADNDLPGVRKDFRETAFFYPQLKTDAEGRLSFQFSMPEATTRWKFMALAHNALLASGYLEKEIITQKPLMVRPNAPRFLRQADRVMWPVKLVNLSDKEINGTVQLELIDAISGNPVDGWFKSVFPVQHFSVEAGKSMSLEFPFEVPEGFGSALTWRVRAVSADKAFSDGEEASLPVLPNRLSVTESMPFTLRKKQQATFRFDKLLKNSSPTLTHQALTVEFTANPAWLAVQALPYLAEYPYECAEQQFNRFYANALAARIAQGMPKIAAVFARWKKDTSALLSNLSKNQELKSALLEETPWVLEAQSEANQRQQIAMLFDLARLAEEKAQTFKKFSDMQLPNGGFSWFANGPDNRYITQYIVSGIGHLFKLGALDEKDREKLRPLVIKAISYLDSRAEEDYRQLLKRKVSLKKNQLNETIIQYLYARSFFPDITIPKTTETAVRFYRRQAASFWLSQPVNFRAMSALLLHRAGDKKKPGAIMRSLRENAINHPELGMYWKELARPGYFWQQAPIENQALMIEAFTEITADQKLVDDLKTWLIRQKQTRHWGSTRATAEACYALLASGSDWLSEDINTEIRLGDRVIRSTDEQTEAGTGYLKKRIGGDEVNAAMGQIKVSISGRDSNSVASSWGAVYWQYMEQIDKISPSSTPLKLDRKLFREVNSKSGPELQEISNEGQLRVGDKVVVRIVLTSDRDMEFLHMKDLRASCMEPVNVISSYKWQGGLGYYESTRDMATHFFFDYLPRGTYVFEYPLFVNQAGDYSPGICSIQCMYAPEFSSHSAGQRIQAGE